MDDMVAEGQSAAPGEGPRLLSLTSPQEATISASNWCPSSLATYNPLALPLPLGCGRNALVHIDVQDDSFHRPVS